MHHFVNQKEAQNLVSKDFINKLDWIVYNSNWNLEQHIKYFHVPQNKSIVIKNAIEKVFKVKFSSSEFNQINSFKEILRLVKKKKKASFSEEKAGFLWKTSFSNEKARISMEKGC